MRRYKKKQMRRAKRAYEREQKRRIKDYAQKQYQREDEKSVLRQSEQYEQVDTINESTAAQKPSSEAVNHKDPIIVKSNIRYDCAERNFEYVDVIV